MPDQITRYTLQFDADTRKLLQSLTQVEKAASDTEKKVQSVKQSFKEGFSGFGFGDIAQIAAGAKLITGTVNAYAQLVNAQQTATQVFGEGYQEISKFAKGAAEDIGLSERAAMMLTTKVAALGKAAGMADEDLVRFSTSLTRLGADLGAAFNTSTERAVEAIISGLSGSSIEPLREYGIVLNDIILKRELLALTGEKVIGTMTQEQRTIAVYSKIISASADYIGQFDREADGLLGTQQRLKASLENTAAALGENYAPAAQSALDNTLSLVRGLATLDSHMGGIGGAILGVGAALLALRPLTTRLDATAAGLAKGGTAARGLGAALGVVHPAIIGVTATLAVMSLYEAQVAKGAQQAAEGMDELAAAAGDSQGELAAMNKIFEGWAKQEASETSFFERAKWGIFGLTGVAKEFHEWWKDKGDLTMAEARQKFGEMALETPQQAILLRDLLLAGDESVAMLQGLGLTEGFMTQKINEGIIATAKQDAAQQSAIITAEQMADALGVGETAQRDYNAALTEDIEVIQKRIALTEKLTEALVKLSESRPERTMEAWDEAFGAETGIDAAAGIRELNTAIQELVDLEGGLPTLQEMIDPEHDAGGQFLETIDNLRNIVGPQLGEALAEGGRPAMMLAGQQLKEQIMAGLAAGGYDQGEIDYIMAQIGLTGENLQARATITLSATVEEEAKTLLDLLKGEGLIGLEDYLKLSASIDVDPEASLNTITALFASQGGIELPAVVADDVDYADAADTLLAADVSMGVVAKMNASAESSKVEGELNAVGPVPLDTEVDLDTTEADSWLSRNRSIVVGVRVVSSPDMADRLAESVGGTAAGTAASAASAVPNIRNYITIPTADPSAHMRALQRWSRLNGQPAPTTRGR